MKNQYVGDIGDYGKYSMLRFLYKKGIKIGINWYLTSNDNSKHGKYTSYLSDSKYSKYDPYVYEKLKKVAFLENKGVELLKDLDLIGNDVVFFEDILYYPLGLKKAEKLEHRADWHNRALNRLKDLDLVFLDPDTAMIGKRSVTEKDGIKYITVEEAFDYYNSGSSIMYYNQRGRYKPESWKEKKVQMQSICKDAYIFCLTYRAGTQRSYIFVLHKEHYQIILKIVKEFLDTVWKDYFFIEDSDIWRGENGKNISCI